MLRRLARLGEAMRPVLSSVFLFFCVSYHGVAMAQRAPARGFAFPVFKTSYPGAKLVLTGQEAKRLAREILPVATPKISRVTVSPTMLVPGGLYIGLSIDLALEAKPAPFSLCEEPHIEINFRYDGWEKPNDEIQLTIRDGMVKDHSFETIFRSGRYRPLPGKNTSGDAAASVCQALATDISGWARDRSVDSYNDTRNRQSALINAIGGLSSTRINCRLGNDRPCPYAGEKLIAVLSDNPAINSYAIFVPGRGRKYHYSHPGVAGGVDYDATLSFDFNDEPETIDIYFSPPRAIP